MLGKKVQAAGKVSLGLSNRACLQGGFVEQRKPVGEKVGAGWERGV